MTRTKPDGTPLSSGQAGTEWAERQIEMQNERLRKLAEGSTYFQHSIAMAMDEAGGRYAKQNPTTVVGADPIAYPRQPENSPWSQQWAEGPDVYGVPIDQMEPVGTDAEIEAAAEILRSRSSAPPDDGASDDVPAVSLAAVDLSEAPTNSSDGDGIAPTMGGSADVAPEVDPSSLSQSPPITGAAVVGDAGGSSAANNTAPRNSIRRL
jgi:hypothetical protein